LKRYLVYRAMTFAKLFTEDEAAYWDGKISWGKVVAVYPIKDKGDRIELLKSVGPKTSFRTLSAAAGRKRKHWLPGGRKRKPPESKGTARDLATLRTLLGRFQDLLTHVILRASGTLHDLHRQRKPLRPRHREVLEVIREQTNNLEPSFRSLVARLQDLIQRDDARRKAHAGRELE
jgi:hypothetical protein